MSEQPIFKISEKMFQELTEMQAQIDANNREKIESNKNISSQAENSTITATETDKLPSDQTE